jgi:hypothetical protein
MECAEFERGSRTLECDEAGAEFELCPPDPCEPDPPELWLLAELPEELDPLEELL